ncbi:hypothetical protein [Gimesia maris]|uniref:hypothetical protein n=1 Tax=Gimesia maris TaxID=122 RepID=UPI0032ED5D75
MATTPIEVYCKPGKTLTVDICARGSNTKLVTARSLTEATNRPGWYTCNVTEALSGYHTLHLYEGTRPAGGWDIYLVDDTTVDTAYEVGSNSAQVVIALQLLGLDSPLNASQTRSALGMSSANLDTQLGNIPTVAEMNARTLTSATYATQAKQNTAQADLDIITGSDGVTLATTQGNYAVSTFDASTDTVDVGKINGSEKAARVQARLADAAIELTVDDATFTPTTTTFETDGTITADSTLVGMAGTWYNSSGDPANDVTYFITASEGTTTNSNDKLKITVETMPAAPADGDVFVVLGAKVK